MKFDLEKLVRNNIRELQPYSSARLEYTGKEGAIFLDANENPFGSPLQEQYNRYPDPLQRQMKFQLSQIKDVPEENIFVGNGSDEVIDLAYRIFCNPSEDNVIICPPTYGMYEVSAHINDTGVKKVNLTTGFQLDLEGIRDAITAQTKIIFICSPNNPTGNNMSHGDIRTLLNIFPGIVMIDEAYIDYSEEETFTSKLSEYPNLVVMQTLSKAWGLAGLRLGICYASRSIIELFNKVKPPYNINGSSQLLAIQALENSDQVNDWVKETVSQRKLLETALIRYPFVLEVYQSAANFILLKVRDANLLYQFLSGKGIIVRNRTKEILCNNCLRITVGTTEQNDIILKAFHTYEQE